MMKSLVCLISAAVAGSQPGAAAPRASGIHVIGWARPTVAGQSTGAAYLTIRNYGPGDDRLTGLASPVASMVTVHRSTFVGGVSRMRPAGDVNIPAGRMMTMGPTGLHIMLMGLKGPLQPGGRLPLTIRFARVGPIRLLLPIQMSDPR